MKYDVVIIGGGASGVIAALKIQKLSNKSVCILEQNDKLLKKILKTGNGKCNIFNKNIKGSYYNDFTLIEKHLDIDLEKELFDLGILVKEEALGRMYPLSESASNVVNILIDALNKSNIDIITSYKVTRVIKKNCFIINNEIEADNVIIATGSLAQEKTNGYDILDNLGHNITKLKPGLVSLITKEKTNHLKGLRVKCRENNFDIEGELLFKENGLSGILAFDLSRLIDKKEKLSFDLSPELSKIALTKYLENSKNIEVSLLAILPKMVCYDVLNRTQNRTISEIVNVIKDYKFTVIDRNGYDTAQITLGGVKVNEINEDFSSKKVEGLYITGEVINVDGACGGYNLYFAWISGIVAALSIVK